MSAVHPTQDQLMEIVTPYQNGDLDQALAQGLALKEAFPDFPITLNLLGLVYIALGDIEAASQQLQRAVDLRPDYAEAQNNLGRVYFTQHRYAQAVTCFERAVKQKPDYGVAWHNMGNALEKIGSAEAAKLAYLKAIAAVPEYMEAHHNLANVFMELGDQSAAEEHYDAALQINPNFIPSLLNLSRCKVFHDGDPHIAAMERLFAEDLPVLEKAQLKFALGKAYDDIQCFNEAFEAFHTANSLLSPLNPYDHAAQVDLFSAIKAVHQSSMTTEDTAPAGPVPIFVVGMPRSGTTLIEQILGSHDQVATGGELGLLQNVLSQEGARTAPLTPSLVEKVRAGYLGGLQSTFPEQAYVTDKLPENFRWIGIISRAMPEAKIVHVHRAPIATCWSIYRHPILSFSSRFRYRLEDIANYYLLYRDLMSFWREALPGRVYELDYERLTQAPEAEIRQMFAGLDLPWQDTVLNFHQSNNAVSTASQLQVRKEIYSKSSQAWRNYERHLKVLTDALSK